MNCHYLVEITEPKNHMVKVTMNLTHDGEKDLVQVFLPSWSPGSYLMREYSRNIRTLDAFSSSGKHLDYFQSEKGTWNLQNLNKSLKSGEKYTVVYQIYCHELTVRTSHVDESHAFLHGPSFLMGIVGDSLDNPTLELRFPALWSKVATGLKDISEKRDQFIYSAPDYDVLIDAPIEIGCHESDGFYLDGKPHGLNFYGPTFPHDQDLKGDIKKIVETVSGFWGDIPYEQYIFITHFAPNLYGGLEHLNSTALQFDGTRLAHRKDYLNWLELVSHEYFHTWNVKRIRPKELGPFDYRTENYTRMHWLTEGLTSFMDRFLVLQSGLMTIEEYIDSLKRDINAYLGIPGRKFHSLEESSFNAWIKLYRPDENSVNSSISYYLKGGLVFLTLYCDFIKGGYSFRDFLISLWDRFKQNEAVGMTKEEVLELLKKHSDDQIAEKFETYLSTTQEIDFETHLKTLGVGVKWKEANTPTLGLRVKYEGQRVVVASVLLDGAAYEAGINAGDEIISFNKIRILKKNFDDLSKTLVIGKTYEVHIIRTGVLEKVELNVKKGERSIESIKIEDSARAETALKNSLMPE